MLTDKEMLEIAEKYIEEIARESDLNLSITKTIEKNYGNIYHYNNIEFIKTGKISHALAGNAPFLIEKETGKIVEFGTVLPLEDYLREYEK